LPPEKIVEIRESNAALRRMTSSLKRHNVEYSPSEIGYYIHLSPPLVLEVEKGIQEEVAAVLKSLRPEESKIIKAAFGIGCEPMSLEEIANKFGDKEDTIQRTLAIALRKCRHPSRSRVLRKYLYGIPIIGEKTGEQQFIAGIFGGL